MIEEATVIADEISRLETENASIKNLKDDVEPLQESDYYEYLKQNGSEQEILDFERLMSHKDDNAIEQPSVLILKEPLQ